MTTFFAAIILLAAVYPSPDVDSDWNLPDRSVACEKIDGYHECNDEIERLLIARHSDTVYRLDESSLAFAVDGGEEFILRNLTQERDRYEGYHYWGTLGDYHLIRIQFYEAWWYGLLHVETGRMTKVGGLPSFSPNGQWMADPVLYGRPAVNGSIDIWRSDDDGYRRDFRAEFRVGPTWSDPKTDWPTLLRGHYGRAVPHWINDELIQVCWGYDNDRKPPKTIGHIRRDGNEWHTEYVDADD